MWIAAPGTRKVTHGLRTAVAHRVGMTRFACAPWASLVVAVLVGSGCKIPKENPFPERETKAHDPPTAAADDLGAAGSAGAGASEFAQAVNDRRAAADGHSSDSTCNLPI